MAQSSGPIASGTNAERQFSDTLWRDLFGDEPGVVGDIDGTAYAVTLPTNSDVAQVGSTTQASTSRVAGFAHRIPSGSPEPVTIPAATGTSRTDIIVVRYNPSNTGSPGPCRLTVVTGTSSAIPSYDASPPGVEDLPLWAITRAPGQALSQATVQRLFPRLAPSLDVPTGAPLPLSSPLGTVVRQGSAVYRRELDAGQSPLWRSLTSDQFGAAGSSGVLAGTAPPAGAQRLIKTFSGTVTINANGDGTVTFPGGAFPNGVLSMSRPTHYTTGVPSNNIEFIPWGVTLSKTNVRCYFGTGTFGGTGVSLTFNVVGW